MPVIQTIAELQRLLEAKRAEITKLGKQREIAQNKVDELDILIAKNEGVGFNKRKMFQYIISSGEGAPTQNKMPLAEMMIAALGDTKGPMGVQDIMAAVLKSGYVTKSKHFRGIVNQTLIKDNRFAKGNGRGMYKLAGKAKSQP